VASFAALAPASNRAVAEYLAVLDDAAFGGATTVELKFVSPTDPAARWTAASGGLAVYAYAYLIDLKHAVIMDVEATTAVRQAEVTAAKTMIERTTDRLDITPARLAADTGYGSAEMLAWLVDERRIEPHIPVFDKSERTDGMGPSRVPTSPTTKKTTPMSVRPESRCENTVAHSPCHGLV
jgi:hypothetical protein